MATLPSPLQRRPRSTPHATPSPQHLPRPSPSRTRRQTQRSRSPSSTPASVPRMRRGRAPSPRRCRQRIWGLVDDWLHRVPAGRHQLLWAQLPHSQRRSLAPPPLRHGHPSTRRSFAWRLPVRDRLLSSSRTLMRTEPERSQISKQSKSFFLKIFSRRLGTLCRLRAVAVDCSAQSACKARLAAWLMFSPLRLCPF